VILVTVLTSRKKRQQEPAAAAAAAHIQNNKHFRAAATWGPGTSTRTTQPAAATAAAAAAAAAAGERTVAGAIATPQAWGLGNEMTTVRGPALTEALAGEAAGQKRHFCTICILRVKTIILPRQARDKHRENSKTDGVSHRSLSSRRGSTWRSSAWWRRRYCSGEVKCGADRQRRRATWRTSSPSRNAEPIRLAEGMPELQPGLHSPAGIHRPRQGCVVRSE
jgi:hypothetical protein